MSTQSKIVPTMPAGKKKSALRIHGALAREIGIAIVSGVYRPGDMLSNEIEASDRLSISRTAYREAMRILSAKGLVESRPKLGTRVSPYQRWHMLDPDILRWMFESNPDHTMVEDLFELRRIIEPEAAAVAADRRSENHIAEMTDALNEMAEHTLASERGRIADRRFHAALLDATGNRFLISLTSSVSAAITLTTVYKQRLTSRYRNPIPDHKKLLDAIAAKDPVKARAAASELIDFAFFDASRAMNLGKRAPKPTADGGPPARRKSKKRSKS